MENEFKTGWIVILTLSVITFGVIIGIIWASVNFRVYTKELNGKAQLKEAEWSKQIAIEEARALRDSATLKAEAEIERAKGVAEANKIISDSLKNNDEYLRYLWIDQLASGNAGQIIYVPTEAGLPILEASRK